MISRAFFLVWRRWGKNEERKGTSLMILALLSYRGGIGVANWIRRYTCFKIETRISFSRIIIKEGARRRVFKLISNKWKIRNRGRRKDMCFHRVSPNFYYSDNSSVPILGWDRASTFFLINRDESFEYDVNGRAGKGRRLRGRKRVQRRFMKHSQTRYVGRGKPLIVPAKEILQGRAKTDSPPDFPAFRSGNSYSNC